LSEATVYDGTVPKSYFTAYYGELHQPLPTDTGFGQFCPSMSTASLARHFGVGYVLAQAGSPAPPGDVLVTTIADEDLYRVPGGGLVTMQPRVSAAGSATAKVLPNLSSDPARIKLRVATKTASTLYIHVTDFPGWTATIDGEPLKLQRWGGTMLAASVPAGNHTIEIAYSPKGFTIGLILAAVAAVVLSAITASTVWRNRKRRTGLASHDRMSPVATVAEHADADRAPSGVIRSVISPHAY
jgi:hypothetical protein